MGRASIAAVLGLLLAGTAGCSDECIRQACAIPEPAVTLNVRDAVDGGPVANPVANGFPCGSSGTCVPLQPDGGTPQAGTTSFDVTAAGYDHVQVVVTVPAATPPECSCAPDYVPQTRDVALTPF